MNWRNIWIVYAKELRDSLRDRRTLFSTIVIPTILMPALMLSIGKIASTVVSKAREAIPIVMILGGEDSPGVVAQLRSFGRFKFVQPSGDWRQQISDKRLGAAVQIPQGFEKELLASAAQPVVIYFYQGELKSGVAVDDLELFFSRLRDRASADRLAERGLPKTLARPFDTIRTNVAPPEKVGGNLFGGIVPYIVVLLCFTGAMHPAIDLTAGEKERGTMETLLCSPVRRSDIVFGKFFLVLTGSMSAIFFSMLSMGLSAACVGTLAPKGALSHGLPDVRIDPFGMLGVVAMIIPVAVLFSAVIFTVSLFAKTTREAQSYVAPMIFLVILPAVIGMLPGVDLNVGLAFVPILNLSLICKEMLSGIWHWQYIVLILSSTSVYAAVALALATRMFKREDVMFRG